MSDRATAKGRPRMTRHGIAYTPTATRKYEAHGRLAAQEDMNGRPPITVPVRAEITVDLPVPTSWAMKRRDAALRGDIRPTTRPDVDKRGTRRRSRRATCGQSIRRRRRKSRTTLFHGDGPQLHVARAGERHGVAV